MSIFEKAFKKLGKVPDELQGLPGEDDRAQVEAGLAEALDAASPDKEWVQTMPGIDIPGPGVHFVASSTR